MQTIPASTAGLMKLLLAAAVEKDDRHKDWVIVAQKITEGKEDCGRGDLTAALLIQQGWASGSLTAKMYGNDQPSLLVECVGEWRNYGAPHGTNYHIASVTFSDGGNGDKALALAQEKDLVKP